VLPVNDAPSWSSATALLTPILPNTQTPAGDTIASVFGGAFVDVDGGTPVGVAVVAAGGAAHGIWQYMLAGDANWINLGAPTDAAARLLPSDAKIRYVPHAGFVGQAVLIVRAWDGTTGTAGGVVNITTTGGATAFSTAELTAIELVQPA
jgi:hypothetical protein